MTSGPFDWESAIRRWSMLVAAGDDTSVLAQTTLALTSETGPFERVVDAAMMRADAAQRLGRWDDVLRYLDDLERLAGSSAAPPALLQLRCFRLAALAGLGRGAEYATLVAELIRAAELLGDTDVERVILHDLAVRHRDAGDVERAYELSNQCLALAAKTGHVAGAELQLRSSIARLRQEPLPHVEAFALAAALVEPSALPFIEAALSEPPTVAAADAAVILAASGLTVLASAEARRDFARLRQRIAGTIERARAPIVMGESDFRRLRQGGACYVDKSRFISLVVQDRTLALLVTAPRRFGKSLNLSMLRDFLDYRTPEGLFEGLAVMEDPMTLQHHRACSVVWISLHRVRCDTAAEVRDRIATVVLEAAENLAPLLESLPLTPFESSLLAAYRARNASWSDTALALGYLTNWLARAGRPVWLLIDEYDAPVERVAGSAEERSALASLRDFLGAGLKDNRHLHKGVMTGVLRVTRESLFSGLNNVVVYPLHAGHLGPWVGFNEHEVRLLANTRGLGHRFEELRDWYDGYRSGGPRVFNPWSVLSFLDEAGRLGPDTPVRPFWANVGSPELIRATLDRHAATLRDGLVRILSGASVSRPMDEGVGLSDLRESSEAFWALLLYTGYLTGARGEGLSIELTIPNLEVKRELTGVVRPWLESKIGGQLRLEALMQALLAGDGPSVQALLAGILDANVSTWDTARNLENPYHMLVLGLIVWLDGPDYRVTSNREAGDGRYDIAVEPLRPGGTAVLIELKACRTANGLEAAASDALEQVRARRYAVTFRGKPAAIHVFAIAGFGKEVSVRVETS